ncbi:metallophosphoesterase [Massilioclostridium coli]|uniref:metallophosphoesterase n=1 Tax=Massilioclostridium coli TaxID=1870991 RepID=UPI0022E71D34|nr:metallophosphoesterase [Massilioclostridium coli]
MHFSKKWLKGSIAALLSATLLLGQALPVSAAIMSKQQEEQLKIAVLSDTHYLSPDMIKDTTDYTNHLNSDRKMFTESAAILDKMLETVKEDQPDVLMISGDLTKDGEKEGHEQLAEKLEHLKEEVPNLKVYVVPGNHDLRNSNAMNFNTEDGTAIPAGRTEPEDFKQIYSDVTFEDESIIDTYTPPEGKEAGGLSYVARPEDGYTVIAIDSARYSADNTDSGLDEHETSGAISADLENWILEQIKEAKDRGDTVIGLEHHGMVPHFELEPTILPMYLVNDYERLSEEFADAGMQYIFTGHMHANDIATMTTEAGNTLYDIETGSVVTYPSPMRFVTINRNLDNGVVTENMSVSTTTNLGPITFTNPLTGEEQTIEDITAYGQQHGFSVDMVSTTVNGFLHGYYDQITEAGGVKPALEALINNLLGDTLPGDGNLTIEQLIDVALPLLLPTTPEAGTNVYYEGNTIKIWIASDEAPDAAPGEDPDGYWASIPVQGLKEALTPVFGTLDSMVANPTILDNAIDALASDLLAVPVYQTESETKTILDLANYAYQSHLAGNDNKDNMPAWVASAEQAISSGEVVDQIVNLLIQHVSNLLTQVLDQVSLKDLTGIAGWNLTTKEWIPVEGRTVLIQPLNDNTKTMINLMAMFVGWTAEGSTRMIPDGYTVQDLITKINNVGGLIGISVNFEEILSELINGTPADPETGTEATEGLLTEEMRQQLGDFANSIVNSLAIDSNYPKDNNTTITNQYTVEKINKTILNQVITYAENAKVSGEYDNAIESVQKSFDAALENAKTVANNAGATQEEVDTAWKTLLNEIHKLGFVAGDKTALASLIEAANEINAELDRYVEAGKAEFTAALEAAQAVYQDGDAMQAEINQVADDLLNAMLNLRYKADKSILEDVLAEAGKVDANAYTAESYAVLTAAVNDAKAVLENENATQEEVDAAVTSVQTAMDNLVAVNGTVNETTTTDNNATQAGQESTTAKANTAKTGDMNPVAGIAAITVAGLVLVLTLKKKASNI